MRKSLNSEKSKTSERRSMMSLARRWEDWRRSSFRRKRDCSNWASWSHQKMGRSERLRSTSSESRTSSVKARSKLTLSKLRKFTLTTLSEGITKRLINSRDRNCFIKRLLVAFRLEYLMGRKRLLTLKVRSPSTTLTWVWSTWATPKEKMRTTNLARTWWHSKIIWSC